jgi:hypothetical protein
MTVHSLGPVLQNLYADQISDLASYPDAQAGCKARVATVGRDYVAVPTGTSTADGITYITGTGVDWQYIQGTSDAKWLSQATWYIDPIAGNNENSGIDSGHPIKDCDEIQRRWGSALAPLAQTTIINVAAGANITTPINLSVAPLSGDTDYLVIIGTPTTISTDSVNVYTPEVWSASGQAPILSLNTLTDWTTAVANHYRISLASDRYIAWPLMVNPNAGGVSTARITWFADPTSTDFTTTGNIFTTSIHAPAHNDAVKIQSLPHIGILNLEMKGQTKVPIGNGGPLVILQNLSIDQLNHNQVTHAPVGLYGCKIMNIASNTWSTVGNGNDDAILGCLFYQTTAIEWVMSAEVMACGFWGTIGQGVYLHCADWSSLFFYCVFENAGAEFYNGSESWFDSCMSFISTNSTVRNYVSELGLVEMGYVGGSGNNYFDTAWQLNGNGIIHQYHMTAPMKIYGPGFTTGGLQDGIIPWSYAPRQFGHGEGTGVLTNGSLAVTVPALPYGTVVNVFYTTNNDPKGEISATSIVLQNATGGFAITSTHPLDSNSVGYKWQSRWRANGGVFTRNTTDDGIVLG